MRLFSAKVETEATAENEGDTNAVQRHKENTVTMWQKDPAVSNCVGAFLNTEYDLRAAAQREIRLHERLKKGDFSYEKGAVGKELGEINRQWWLLHRLWWQYRCGLSIGSLGKALDRWRSDPKWYMHPFLVEDCAGKGGCCSRDCGCCENRLMNSKTRKLGAGHCTSECGCCQKAQGFVFKMFERTELKEWVDFSPEYPLGFYYRRIAPVLLFGKLDPPVETSLDVVQELPTDEENVVEEQDTQSGGCHVPEDKEWTSIQGPQH